MNLLTKQRYTNLPKNLKRMVGFAAAAVSIDQFFDTARLNAQLPGWTAGRPRFRRKISPRDLRWRKRKTRRDIAKKSRRTNARLRRSR